MFKSFIKPNKPETKKSNKHIYIDDPKNDPRTNVFHLTDDYFCSGCYTILEKEKINSKTNSTFINNEEDNENLDAYFNPDMEEETKCEFCLKLSNCSIATCLVEGKNNLIFNRPTGMCRMCYKYKKQTHRFF
jgi:hypothetical protein